MKAESNSMRAQESRAVSVRILDGNLSEIKNQVTSLGKVLQKIVNEIEHVPDARAVDAFKQQVLQKQMVLETLVEENTSELEILKHDVVALSSDLREIKTVLMNLQDVHCNSSIPSALSTITSPNFEDMEMGAVDALRNHPLSSIPPKQLSESEAINFLKAIDEIVAHFKTCDCSESSASGE
ncbi:MAG: hypothetical protein JXR76_26050 [Deltaproteobacteria bacterium]|nr:hypothetical protein [Deltaproteobacteria bacterium]